jgi:YVTN family beta-propeller protein
VRGGSKSWSTCRGLRPGSFAFSNDGFVTGERSAAVTVLDGKTIDTIKIPSVSEKSLARPMGSVLSPDGNYVFVSTGRAESVAMIDVASHKVLDTIADVGSQPRVSASVFAADISTQVTGGLMTLSLSTSRPKRSNT